MVASVEQIFSSSRSSLAARNREIIGSKTSSDGSNLE